MNHLKYPKIDCKTVHYGNDGTGRDTYVSQTNGGLLSSSLVKQLEVSPKPTYTPMIFEQSASPKFVKRSKKLPPQLHQRIVHYYGDGKGRDNFVTINDGGQTAPHHWKTHVDCFFKDSLRQYREGWNSQPDALKYLCNNRRLKSLAQLKSWEQTQLSNRLSSPKVQLVPQKTLSTEYQTLQSPEYQTKAKVRQRSMKIL